MTTPVMDCPSNEIQNLKQFKEFRSKVEKQLGKRIKALRFDQNEEYLNQDVQSYLRDNEILS